ncbi:glycosyltransferase family 4 protein [Patescibacteria group bacterium]
MFKIAFIGQKGIPVSQGGVERHVEELSIRLAKNGHEVFVYTRSHCVPKEYRKYEAVNLVSLPSINSKNLDAISHTFVSTLSAIFKEKVDVIHYHGVGPSLLAWLPKIFNKKIKVVSTVHSPDWEHQKWSNFAQKMLKLGCQLACKFADEIVAVSRDLQKYCLSQHRGEAIYIPNGVNVDKNNNINENNERILDSFNLESQKYLLVVTRLIKHKGVHYLIEAFKKFKEKYPENNFKLVVVGSTAFTESYQNFLMTLKQGREDIVFTGIQTGENLETLYKNSYLYAHPSESEGLSISVLEAMSYGKAVLVADISENLELISGNINTGAVGFDFKNKNVIDLMYKIELLIHNPELVYTVGKKAQSFVKLYYNWEEIVDRIERVYKNMVSIKDKMPSRLRLALSRLL